LESTNPPYEELAELVRRARVSRGMSQRQLSRALRRSGGYVGHLERGRIRPNVETLKELSAVLGLVYGELAVEAGYITRQEFDSPIDEGQLARLTEIGDLSDEEWESLRDFARYLRSRRRS
jgi:transcriptional regulator with XRE-family HTH domain